MATAEGTTHGAAEIFSNMIPAHPAPSAVGQGKRPTRCVWLRAHHHHLRRRHPVERGLDD